MKITKNIEFNCPSGFYCMKNARNKCPRLRFENNRPYCEVFYPFLDTDSKGDVIKIEDCLLAEREARVKR
jgi:hypothetical protein